MAKWGAPHHRKPHPDDGKGYMDYLIPHAEKEGVPIKEIYADPQTTRRLRKNLGKVVQSSSRVTKNIR